MRKIYMIGYKGDEGFDVIEETFYKKINAIRFLRKVKKKFKKSHYQSVNPNKLYVKLVK